MMPFLLLRRKAKATPNALRVIAANQFLPQGKEARTFLGQYTRYPYMIASDASSFVVSVANIWFDQSGENANTNPITISDMSIESNTGVIVPVTFNGSRSITLGTSDYDIHSNEISANAFGLATIPKNVVFWIKTKISLDNTAYYIPSAGTDSYGSHEAAADYAGGQAYWYNPAATTVSSTDTAGVYTTTGSAPTSRHNGFKAILLGRPVNSSTVAFALLGDSIMGGQGDDLTNVPYGMGFACRGMRKADRSIVMPSINFSVPSRTIPAYLGTNTAWRTYLTYVQHAIIFMGTNDLSSGGSGNVATIESNFSALWALLRTGSIQKIINTKLLPRTGSTDSWKTAVNQTYNGNWGPTQKSQQINDWLVTKQADATIDYVVTMDNTRDTSVPDAYKWLSDGSTANLDTVDGTHPKAKGHEDIAIELRTVTLPLGGYSAP